MSFLGDLADNLGSAINAPELGFSELFNGGKATANTGSRPYVGPMYNGGQPSSNSTAYANAYVDKYGNKVDGINPGNVALNGSNISGAFDDGTGTTYNGAGSTNYAQLNAGTIAQLGQSGNVIQSALDRLPNQLNIAHANIGTQFGQKDNELNTGLATNQNSYDTSTTQNGQSFRSNKNTINDQASNGLRGLQRLLGSYGAVGSDMGLAGRAVSDQASQQNAGAGQNFAQNQSGLDTNWGNYKNQFDNEKKKLVDWRTQQDAGAESQSLTTRQDLLSKLADIRGQESAARGGAYAGSAQPYLDQANALSGQIDNLGRLNPTYTGNTPQYTAAPLSSYDTGNGAQIATQGAQGGGMNTPWLNMLLGKDKKQTVLG